MNKPKYTSLFNKNKKYNKNDKRAISYKIIDIKLKKNKRFQNYNLFSELNINTDFHEDNQMKNSYKKLMKNVEKNYFTLKNKRFYQMKNLPIIKNNNNNLVSAVHEQKYYKIIDKRIIGNEENKNCKNKLFSLPQFNYSFSLDKNNIFCLKYKKPKENFRKQTINFINQITYNNDKDEYKQPKMIQILERNDKIYDEVISQPWKYPNLFKV